MECPKCGRLLLWGVGAGHPDQRWWSPVTSQLTCSRCLTVYTLGLIAWPSGKGKGAGRGLPIDQQPTIRQLAEIRQRTGGFWAKTTHRGAEAVNRYVEEGCCCDPLPWRVECPVHGQIGISEEGGDAADR